MPGRGRPRKLKASESRDASETALPEKRELPPPPRRPQKCLAKEEQTSTTGKKAAKKEVEQKDELPEHNGAGVTKGQPETPVDTARKPAKGCSGRSTSQKENTKQPKPDTDTHETRNRIVNGARPKTSVRANLPKEEGRGDIPDQQTLKYNTKVCRSRVKICDEQAKSPAETVNEEESTVPGANTDMKPFPEKKKPDTAKKPETNTLLRKTLETLKIKMNEKSTASKVINKIEKEIRKHLRERTICFKDVTEPLHTGSYYEHLKISNPDEFDIMFCIPVERADINPFGGDGAFYSVSLKRGNNPLNKFQSDSKPLSASEMLTEFRNEVKKCMKNVPGVEINRKKKGCPAVTLTINVDSFDISLDVVLCLEVKSSWPPFTQGGFQIEKWLGSKVKQEYKYKPYYLVPKYEGKGTKTCDGVPAKDVWRVSFSHVEKGILNNHGSEKTCCEKDGVHCCRKECLKLLKYLLSLLKVTNSTPSFDKFCSYHAKTTLLHACCSRPKDSEWALADLSQCFHQLLEDFEKHLTCGQLYNFFIPTQNLLSGCNRKTCEELALSIRQQREEGFPIFKYLESDMKN